MNSELDTTLLSFDECEALKARMQLLGKIAAIGEWIHRFTDDEITWSDYLHDFYELNHQLSPSNLLCDTQLYQGDEAIKMQLLLERVTINKVTLSDEFKINMPDGRIKWHRTTIHPINNQQGKLLGLYGLLQNTTDRKQKEANNEKRYALFRHIFDRLPSELVVLNNAGQYLYANQSAIQSKLNCSTLADHQHSELNDQLNELGNWVMELKQGDVIEDCLQNKKVVTFEEKVNDTNGLDRTILRNLYPLLDQKGEVEFLIGHGVDISARKQSELELQRMAIVAEKTNGIVMVTDPDRKITWVNNSFEQILGYRAEEIIGIDPADFLQGPETSQQTIRDIAESLKASGTFSGEILNYTKSGKQIWLYLNIAAVYDDQGKLLNYVAVENDITVIKLAEQHHQKVMERERELNQFKTQFINLASHQFRAPLATIRSSIDLLDLKLKSIHLDNAFQAFFAKHKAIIDEETTRMTELMENILDIGRIDEGKIELFKKNLPFKKFMDDFVQSNHEPGGEYRKLDYHFGTSDKIISIDEILLRNVLRNIVSNAYKYSQGKPAPELKVNFEKNAYWITIKDYGIGVPDKDQPYLFESFFRASNARIFPGSGLGLMIAKKLIALHGGNIHFSSKVGAGCCVTIHLPA